jgi:hypothetical protein
VAHVIGKAQTQKRQRHPAALVLLPHEQHHPAAALNVVDLSLPGGGGGGGGGGALALPVEQGGAMARSRVQVEGEKRGSLVRRVMNSRSVALGW